VKGGHAVLLPGFGGGADQPILVKLSAKLEALGFTCERLTLGRQRPSRGLEREMAVLAAVATPRSVLIGRSFGGRVCARFAVAHGARAVVLLGFPVRPPGKRRPEDEAALKALRCPTLVVQGDRDELGPLPLLRRLARANAALTLHVLPRTPHAFGRQEPAALETVVRWLASLPARQVRGG
jgi:predicted alpha/beta-hydrolase family hydrolase